MDPSCCHCFHPPLLGIDWGGRGTVHGSGWYGMKEMKDNCVHLCSHSCHCLYSDTPHNPGIRLKNILGDLIMESQGLWLVQKSVCFGRCNFQPCPKWISNFQNSALQELTPPLKKRKEKRMKHTLSNFWARSGSQFHRPLSLAICNIPFTITIYLTIQRTYSLHHNNIKTHQNIVYFITPLKSIFFCVIYYNH